MSRGRPDSWKGSTPSIPRVVSMMMRMTSEVLSYLAIRTCAMAFVVPFTPVTGIFLFEIRAGYMGFTMCCRLTLLFLSLDFVSLWAETQILESPQFPGMNGRVAHMGQDPRHVFYWKQKKICTLWMKQSHTATRCMTHGQIWVTHTRHRTKF